MTEAARVRLDLDASLVNEKEIEAHRRRVERLNKIGFAIVYALYALIGCILGLFGFVVYHFVVKYW